MTADFGIAIGVDALAHGQPGQRTFQIRVLGSRQQSASLWMEKQQLQALSLALTQVLSQLGQEELPAHDLDAFPAPPDHDFRVGRMAIGYDPSERVVVLHAFELGRDDEEEDPDVRVRLTENACAALNTRLTEIIASGRPVCPLCGVPLDPAGHACVRANGHSKQPIPEDHLEDE